MEIFKKSFFVKLTLLVLWLGVWFFVFSRIPLSTEPSFVTPEVQSKNDSKPKQPITFSYTACDPQKNSRPLYNIAFSEFKTEMGDLGMFKIGIYHTAKLKNLKLTFYEYSQTSASPILVPSNIKLPISKQINNTYQPDQMSSPLTCFTSIFANNIMGSELFTIPNDLNIEDVAEISAIDFQYQLYFDNE